MAYATAYLNTFETTPAYPGGPVFTGTVEILRKDYSGPVKPIYFGVDPVLQKWQADNPHEPIKGCSLELNIQNRGTTPITDFYSINDDEFMVKFSLDSNIKFVGFLVQDDCAEDMVDYNHNFTLSANDNLGLLKDVALNAKPVTVNTTFEYIVIGSTAPHAMTLGGNYTPRIGETFEIIGHATLNGFYTPTAVTPVAPNLYDITVSQTVTTQLGTNGFVRVTGLINLTKRNSLLSIIQACLYNTGLELNTTVYDNLFETRHNNTLSPLSQTYEDALSFLKDDVNYEDCYTVLTKILEPRGLTLFQSEGGWRLVRWNELRYGAVNGFVYDNNFNLVGTVMLPAILTGSRFDPDNITDFFPETGLIRSIARPFKFDRETFNYKQPQYLLKNFDMQNLGALIRQYIINSPTRTVKEYVFTDWEDNFGGPPFLERFIRVVFDVNNKEIERYAVVRGTPFDTARGVQSKPIEVAAGDKIKFSFSYRTNDSQPGNVTTIFAVRLFDGVNNRYVDETPSGNGAWKTGVGFNYIIPSGDNTNVYHSVEIASGQTPFAGLVYCYLAYANETYGIAHETHYKDIRFEYLPFINDSQKVIGHVHKTEQEPTIKNVQDIEIFTDDSPRPSVAGALYLGSYSGVLQNRTANWYRAGFTETRRLGDIVTFEELFWRRVPRTKLEGDWHNTAAMSMLSVLRFEPAGIDLSFIFGSLQINYANSAARFTAWEQFRDGETDTDLTSEYTFTYLYDNN